MFRPLAPATDNLTHICRVEEMLRERFEINQSEIILVSENAGTRPGFPPHETNIIFWKEEIRYRLKVFAKAADVTLLDVPVKWLLPSLQDNGEGDCC